uniref:Peptidase S1 domain-containing protein n=1 Tax=Amphilophus citrinellus TaxID=61819 RepID=A0A3Q0RFL4_AMPCI
MQSQTYAKLRIYIFIYNVLAGVDLHKRIYGGQKCPKREHLYYVKITAESSGTYCGGSLIHPQWVLTAAHCWKPGCSLVRSPRNGPSGGFHSPFLDVLVFLSYHLECGESDTLQCAVTAVVACPAHNRPGHVFCGQRAGVDACYGDSGGGVVFKDRLHGVISFTCNTTHACAAPAGFMNVCSYLGWIQNTIRSNK